LRLSDWKRICCAVDLSEPARLGLTTAVSIASRLQSELTLVHVNEAALRLSGGDLGDLGVTLEEALDATRQEIAPKLRGLQQDAERILGRSVGLTILAGRAADEIVRFVRAGSYQLLVMGTHGRTGVRRLIHGSVAEEVSRLVDCPILLVRRSAGVRTEQYAQSSL
jgi:nucleotide-binding universal stress UspA family protein